jgi:hypothetical protein
MTFFGSNDEERLENMFMFQIESRAEFLKMGKQDFRKKKKKENNYHHYLTTNTANDVARTLPLLSPLQPPATLILQPGGNNQKTNQEEPIQHQKQKVNNITISFQKSRINQVYLLHYKIE